MPTNLVSLTRDYYYEARDPDAESNYGAIATRAAPGVPSDLYAAIDKSANQRQSNETYADYKNINESAQNYTNSDVGM